MKRTLQIAIDANRVTCGKCERHTWTSSGGERCLLFTAQLSYGPGGWQRCAPCLAAEVRE